MSLLLIQSCSQTKKQVPGKIAAFKLYDGYFFRILKNALGQDYRAWGIDMVILSAEYGIIRPEDEIEYYDRRITSERAKELRDQVLADVERVVRGKDYDEILVNAGKEYAIALEGIEEVVDTKVTHIQGQGIGEKGNDLKYQVLEKNPSVELSGGDG